MGAKIYGVLTDCEWQYEGSDLRKVVAAYEQLKNDGIQCMLVKVIQSTEEMSDRHEA